MILKLISTAFAVALASYVSAQTIKDIIPLEISGSVDTYYKYDFSDQPNIGTSFGNDHNSVSLGMIDLLLKKTTGKASFVGELSFGPRGQYGSIPEGDKAGSENSFHIQNLFVKYAFTPKLSATAGYMATFIGLEVISPLGNYNYSTSYLFTNGPFQNGGIKLNYEFSPKVSLMAGLFNDWNVYRDENGVSHFGAQLTLAPAEGFVAYLNMLTGRVVGAAGNGSIYDLTTTYQATESIKLGLNAATYDVSDGNGGYRGAALYLQNALTENFSLGLRGEYFKSKDDPEGLTLSGVVPGESVVALTLSANLKAGGLTFIPEIRMDNGSSAQFLKNNLNPTKTASQFVLAAVYAF
jgi:hypothetical protein